MNERLQDFELLRNFVRQGDEAAFASLVRRHLDLVYATALRKLCDPDAAEEVAQNVFAALARKAWQFASDESVPAWLYRTTLLEAKMWLRVELRRRRREQTAAELGTTMNSSTEPSSPRTLVLLLDEALLSLRDKDRTALLLRYYESRSLREVGLSLGVTEDAAQKRVTSALEKIAKYFQHHGYANATTAAAAAVLQQTAASAPPLVLSAVLQAATTTAPPILAGMTALLSRLVSTTNVQTAVLCAAILVLPPAWQWQELQAARNQTTRGKTGVNSTRAEIELLQTEIDRLRRDSARLTATLSAASQEQNRNEEAARQLTRWKARLRDLLAASDYRWPGDLPFVRLPKWAARNLDSKIPVFNSSGNLAVWVEELLNLAPEQKQAVESELTQYLNNLDRLANSRAYETNARAFSQKDFTTKAIAVPALGEEGQAMADSLVTNVRAILGSERSGVVLKPISSTDMFLGRDLISSPQLFVVGVRGAATDNPTFSLSWNGHFGKTGPQVVPWADDLPPFLLERFEPWLRAMGVTNQNILSQRP